MFCNAPVVYRERGAFLRRLEQYEKAKASYDTAYQYAEDDLHVLMGRSQVATMAVQPKKAYLNAEAALKIQPNNLYGRNLQAQALYSMDEYERSLVVNFRGARYRRCPPYFYEGISIGMQTIQDCIGENAGTVMLDFLPIIKRKTNATVVVHEHEPKPSTRVSRIPKAVKQQTVSQSAARQHATLSRVMAMKYLGAMASDKFFLEQLEKDNNLTSANSKGNEELKSLVKDALETLSYRQEMLRSQRPYYSIKYGEQTQSRYQKKFMQKFLEAEQHVAKRTADCYLKQMEKLLAQNKVALLLIKAERMREFLDFKTQRVMPDKHSYLDRLYRMVGKAYLSMYRLSYKMNERGNRRRIGFLLGLRIGRPRSYDSVVENFPRKYENHESALKKAQLALETCENGTMRCWLHYEIAILCMALKNYSLSKFSAKRCQREAQEINSTTWWLNGCFAMLSGDAQQCNVNEVRLQVEEAYEYCKDMKNGEVIGAFLSRCVDLTCEIMESEDREQEKKRENQIMETMDDPIKAETKVLLKRIALMPVGRRFSVLPGKVATSKTSVRQKRRQVGLTIVPEKLKALPKPPVSKVAGYQLFSY